MTKEEIYKTSDVLNTILDNYLHGGEAAEVVTKFEDELIKLNLTKEKLVSEDLGDYINELSKQFPEVSFAKLSRIAVRVAKWQKEQKAKDAIDCEICEVEVDTCGCGLNSHTRLSIVVDDEELRNKGFKDGDKCKVVILKDTPEYIEGVKGSYTTTTK